MKSSLLSIHRVSYNDRPMQIKDSLVGRWNVSQLAVSAILIYFSCSLPIASSVHWDVPPAQVASSFVSGLLGTMQCNM